MHSTAVALNTIRDELSVKYLERRQVVEFITLTLLSKQHGFILGPPGTAKSELIRDFVTRLTGLPTYFEALLSRTRPDAAILGPYNLPELRDKGDFHRKIKGFLPEATIAFLDEIGKMSPTAGHDLLSILNERLYHEVNGGRSSKMVPLYSAFTASNELIAGESDDAAALWDRLLMRIVVDYIQESSNFAKLLTGATMTTTPVVTEVDWIEVADTIDNVVPKIAVPDSTIQTMIRLRDELRGAGVVVSDRRWRQSIRVLQANAFLAGRTEVLDDDVSQLRYVLWDSPEHLSTVERLCLTVSNPEAEKVMTLLDASHELTKGIEDRKGTALESRAQYGAEANQKLRLLVTELDQMRQDALTAGRGTSKLDEAARQLEALHDKIFVECLDMTPEQVARQKAGGR